MLRTPPLGHPLQKRTVVQWDMGGLLGRGRICRIGAQNSASCLRKTASTAGLGHPRGRRGSSIRALSVIIIASYSTDGAVDLTAALARRSASCRDAWPPIVTQVTIGSGMTAVFAPCRPGRRWARDGGGRRSTWITQRGLIMQASQAQ